MSEPAAIEPPASRSLTAAAIVPTHNRVQLLERVLDSILGQTVPAEVFVMDDACSDDTPGLIQRRYPRVRYYREEKGGGPTFQRNKAAAMTQADILFTIDDDCILASPRIFEQTLEAFDHARVAAVTMPFIDVLKDKTVQTSAPKDGRVWATYDYFGGMVALRRDVFLALGGYRDFYFIQVEEPDLAARMYEAGYIVRLGWADPIEHLESPLRDAPGRKVQWARNQLLWSYFNVPLLYFPPHLLRMTLKCLWHGVRHGQPMLYVRGVARGFSGMLQQRGRRQPVSRKTFWLSHVLRRAGAIDLEKLEPRLPLRRTMAGEGRPG